MEKPSGSRHYWEIYLSDLPDKPAIAFGYGVDYEDAWHQALRAKHYINNYGLPDDKL